MAVTSHVVSCHIFYLLRSFSAHTLKSSSIQPAVGALLLWMPCIVTCLDTIFLAAAAAAAALDDYDDHDNDDVIGI